MIQVRRVYDPARDGDGTRILVDALWPRGITKAAPRWDRWMKELAPSATLRRWFGHDPEKWDRFLIRYHEELEGRPDAVTDLARASEAGVVTLVYAARDERHNNAVALKRYLNRRTGGGRSPGGGPVDILDRVAEATRLACVEAALEAYEDAGIRGLCLEGRWEVAVGAARNVDVARIVERARQEPGGGLSHSAIDPVAPDR